MQNTVLSNNLLSTHQAPNICVPEARLYSSIHTSVRALFFLATPHRGSAIATTAVTLAKLTNFVSFGTGVARTDILKSLERDSRILLDVSTDFRMQTPKYIIFSFLEQRLMVGLKDLVGFSPCFWHLCLCVGERSDVNGLSRS